MFLTISAPLATHMYINLRTIQEILLQKQTALQNLKEPQIVKEYSMSFPAANSEPGKEGTPSL